MTTHTVKILTYNVHKGLSAGNQRLVLHEIKEALGEVGADIIFLQEIQGEHCKRASQFDNWPSVSQFEFLADKLWPHHVYGKNAIYDDGHHGNAILSKYPFQRWENINVSVMRSASRSLLHGVIELPGSEQPLHIVCVHLGLLQLERDRQLRTLVSRIESHIPHHEPLIIAGDFNDWRGWADRHFSEDLGVREAFKDATGKHAKTFPARLPMLRMDRIYSRGLEVIDCQLLRGHPWHKLSDHTPLASKFTMTID